MEESLLQIKTGSISVIVLIVSDVIYMSLNRSLNIIVASCIMYMKDLNRSLLEILRDT